MQLILALPPLSPLPPVPAGVMPAYAAYRAGRDGHLYRAEMKEQPSGGVMALADGGFRAAASHVLLAGEVLREAAARRFTGILLDLPAEKTYAALVSLLEAECRRRSMTLYLPEALASASATACVLVETAVSGGTLKRRISEAVSRYGADRAVLDIERVRMDFTLPSRDGQGEPLSQSELRSLMVRRGARAFFSNELCAWYFNYRSGGKTHFVLYDDAESIRRKLSLASRLGVKRAFLYYPEVADVIREIAR